jgi:hypothetical protein
MAESAQYESDAIRYLAPLARGMLKATIDSQIAIGVEVDLKTACFTAAFDSGIWASPDEEYAQTISAAISQAPEERFKSMEQNFWTYVEEAKFKEKPELVKDIGENLGELVICVVGLYILLSKTDDAIAFAKKGFTCVSLIQLPKYCALI